MSSQAKIQHSFLRALSSYDEQAVVQKKCASTLIQHLENRRLKRPLSRVFEFGCGTGFLTKQLFQSFCIGDFITNDLVEECHAYLPAETIEFIAGDIDQIAIPANCDLICAGSSIQWSSNIAKLLSHITESLNRYGYLALSSFSSDHFKQLTALEMDQNSEKQTRLSYWPAETWQKILEPNYNIELLESEETTLWFNSVREVLLHLRLTGVNGVAGQTWSQQKLADFEKKYHNKFAQNQKIPLSYKPIYIVASKK
ncbi:MAG: malonyl-ACP O-methyltransferase BioC [Acidiferrobacterales bacterium]|nr:malonyl-ACP O-methyltransferase BioC [Acidiferrobacterales bacterium]